MAIMIPDRPADNNSPGEIEVYNALRQLPDDHCVIHSLRWIGTQKRGQLQGEGDFVIIDPYNGILVIEVKSGGIRFDGYQWYQKNLSSGYEKRINDPEKQASTTKFRIIGELEGKLPRSILCPVYHAVWFPSVHFKNERLPMNLDKEMLLDSRDLIDTNSRINCVFEFWHSIRDWKPRLTPQAIKEVLKILAPSFSLMPSLHAQYTNQEKKFLKMTEEQARIIDFLEEQKSAVISGAAGTGKTVLAIEKARRLSKTGNVLFLCFNSALRRFLAENNHVPSIEYHTYHSLIRRLLNSESEINEIDWDCLESSFCDYMLDEKKEWPFDHIIIDEGQDFKNDWSELLSLRSRGYFYVFLDRCQNIQREDILTYYETAECRLVLHRNCRNTNQIARTSYSLAELHNPDYYSGVEGRRPAIHCCPTSEVLAETLKTILQKPMLEGELQLHQIALITTGTLTTSLVNDAGKRLNLPLADYPQENKITFSTVRKFKGLEAKVVILTDIELEQFDAEDFKNAMYVACSRAVHELHLVVNDDSKPKLRKAIKAIAPDRKIAAQKKSLANLLGANWI